MLCSCVVVEGTTSPDYKETADVKSWCLDVLIVSNWGTLTQRVVYDA